MPATTRWGEPAARVGLFLLCLVPFAYLLYGAVSGALGPDPAEEIMHVTGEWAMRILILTLLMSPLREWRGWRFPLKVRRMLGLFAFFYACVHLVSFFQFFTGWGLERLLEELVERPYVTVGFGAWLLMLPLALTSTRKMQRRLGRNWRRLHRLVYPSALLVCLHIIWLSRSDIGSALVHSSLILALLAWRIRPLFERFLPTPKKV